MKIVTRTFATILLTSSVTAFAETPDAKMIDHYQKEAAEDIEAREKATPADEARPAATVKNKEKVKAKHKLIKQQKKHAQKSIEDEKAASPDVEARPAAVTNQK